MQTTTSGIPGDNIPQDNMQTTTTASLGESEFGQRLEYTVKPKYQDLWAAICFYIHVVLIIVVAIYFWLVALPDALEDATPSPTSVADVDNGEDDENTTGIWITMFIALIAGGLFGLLWLQCIRMFAATIIKIMLIVMIACYALLAVWGLMIDNMLIVVIGVLACLISALYAYCIRHRIPFASACLEIASTIAQTYTGTIKLSLITVIINFVWIVIWCFAFWAVELTMGGITLIPLFLLLVSLYWGTGVWRNVSHTTACGVTAAWYFTSEKLSNPSVAAYKRTMTTSFGSVCLGSFIVAVLQAIRAILRSQRDQSWACIVECLLGCIESLIRYFNNYAYAQCAIYGSSFVEAAKATWNLFATRGFEAIINDDLSGLPVLAGSLLGFVVSAVVGYVVGNAFYASNSDLVFGLALLGGVLGYVTCVCILMVVSSNVVALFVCYAEDPATMAQNRPQEFAKMAGLNEDWAGAARGVGVNV